jgi:hypothetical protein
MSQTPPAKSKKPPSQRNSAKKGGARARNHDQPIIINNSSVEVRFDGDNTTVYRPITTSASHQVAVGHTVKSVKIIGSGENIPLPSHGEFTVTISGRHKVTGSDSNIEVINTPHAVEIHFNGIRYRKISGGSRRKRHKSRMRHVRRLTVKDNLSTKPPVDFSHLLPPHNTVFDIELDERD